MPNIYYTDYSNQDFTQQRIVAAFLNLELPAQQIPNKYSPLILVDGKLVMYESNAISIHLAQGTKLLGSSFQEEVDMYSWLEYFNIELYPLLHEIYGQIFGKLPANQQKYTYATEEFKRILKVLDERLKSRALLVGDSLTLADIAYCCHLQKAFRLVVTPDIRKKFVNLNRWYAYVRNLKPFVTCIGKMFLCDQAFKVDFSKVQEEIIQKQQKTEQKAEKPAKKKQEKKQQKKEVEKQKQVKQEQKQQQKKVQQKQGQFNLDSFKRAFQNSENKSTVIDEMVHTLGEGWSIWKVYYSKDVTEGKVDYLTCNLAKGTLQRLEALRKTGFGNWGVYFSEQAKEYQIRGVMLWKGQDVATAWKEHPSHQYHIFEKLNPKDAEHQKIIKDYWLENETSEGLALHASYKLI